MTTQSNIPSGELASWNTAIIGPTSETCEYQAAWRCGGQELGGFWETLKSDAEEQINQWWARGNTGGVMVITTRTERVETFTQNAKKTT